MQRAISTHFFVNHRLTTALLEKIQHCGFPLVEFFCARQHLDYQNKAQVAELGHWFRESDLKLWSLHAPMYNDDVWGRTGPNSVINICEREKVRRITAVDEIKRAIEVAEYVPFRYLVQHLGVGGEEFDERKIDPAFSSLDELTVFAKQRGVEILLENIPNGLSTASRLHWFLTETHLKLCYCFDTGHAHMAGSVASEFELMKDRIRSTHVHDNNGQDDQHLVPLIEDGGSIDWTSAVRLLRSCGDQFPILLELKDTPDRKTQLDDAVRSFERLESIR
jgi:sugar phosphate isomerase/epimerase